MKLYYIWKTICWILYGGHRYYAVSIVRSCAMKKALVTGAMGFIGSHLVDRLLSDGWEVTAVDNLLTGKRENLGHHAQNGKLHVVVANTKQLDVTYFKDIDVVFNLAAIARTPWTIADPMLSHQMTTTNTLHALLMAKKAGVKRFVHSSSCIVYVPNTPYYVAKQAAEEYVRIFQSLYGLSTVSLRYSNVYGMRQSEEGIEPERLCGAAQIEKRERPDLSHRRRRANAGLYARLGYRGGQHARG
jgi:nucleoside-diphosphate-sugar epimerase